MGSEVSITQAGDLNWSSGRLVIWSSGHWFHDRIARMKQLVAALLLLAAATALAQPAPDTAALLKTVPDLTAKLARFKPVRMPYNEAALSGRECQMIEQLVIACRELE